MLLLPKLVTNRLILRAVTLADADSIFAYACNPNVARYVSWESHRNVEETKGIITNFFFKNYEKGSPEPWAITFSERPDWVIGLVGCRLYDEDPKSMELAYVLAEEHWGKGVTTEASQCILPYVFQNYQPEKIVGRYAASNPASGRVMEKLGMKFIENRQEIKKGKPETMVYYALQLTDLK